MTSITRHDILNQLMIMRGYLELASENQDPLEARELRKKALGATKNIEFMIEFTKDYQEIGVHEPVWHDVHAMVDASDPNLKSTNLQLENHLQEVEVLADPMLVKVIENIVDNSARHGVHAGFVRFSSETKGDVLKIICEDDGVGVLADEKDKIFERGFGKHTGLGLYFARDVLNITGIAIKENGEPGKGARFEISVPKERWRYVTRGAIDPGIESYSNSVLPGPLRTILG
jgi:signal transduction histidine kinase